MLMNSCFRSLILTLVFFLTPAMAGVVRTPAIGSAERNAIINLLRVDFYQRKKVEVENPQQIIFVLKYLKVKDGWACVNVQATRDGDNVGEANWKVLRQTDGTWKDVDYFGKLFPFESEEETLDALDMKKGTAEKLQQKLPGCPREIFP